MGTSTFDYEAEQSIVVELKCSDYGDTSLSKTVYLQINLQDCNDNAPEISMSLSSNETVSIAYETLAMPFLLTQFHVHDRDRFQSNVFTYTFTVTPALDLILTDNGTLILRSLPIHMGQHRINVSVSDVGNLTSSISLSIDIYSINQTTLMRTFSLENTSVILILSFFVIVFLASLFIGICFLVAFLLRTKKTNHPKTSSCVCCRSCFNRPTKSIRNSTCESMNSSNERADSSQKTSIEVLDDGRVRIDIVFIQFSYSCLVSSRLSHTR
jgi:hypothetical protein